MARHLHAAGLLIALSVCWHSANAATLGVEYEGSIYVIEPDKAPSVLTAAQPEVPRLFIDPSLLPRDQSTTTESLPMKRVCRVAKSCKCVTKLIKVHSQCGVTRTIKRRTCTCKKAAARIIKKTVVAGCNKKVIRIRTHVPIHCEMVPVTSRTKPALPEATNPTNTNDVSTEDAQ